MRRAADRRSNPAGIVAELALPAVHLIVVAGFGRLFDGSDWFAPLAGMVLIAHIIAFAARRLDAPRWVVAAIAAFGWTLVASWLILPESTTWGMPHTGTIDAAASALTEARVAFREVIAPTDAIIGFQLVAGVAAWAMVWFADWAAFRLRTSVEAIAPAAVIFTFCTMLGSEEHRFLAASAFAAGSLLFIAAHRGMRAEVEDAWLGSADGTGGLSLMRVGFVLGAAALLIGLAAAPLLPGADEDGAIDWRRRSDATRDRTVLSPILDLKPRLVAQSDEAFFTVRAERPSYWRITGLDEFDGRLWQIDKRFGSAGGSLRSANPTGEGEAIYQLFEIGALDDLWVPAAFEPRSVRATTVPLRWDTESSTLIVDDSVDGTAGISYELVSVQPQHEPAVLDAAADPPPPDLARFIDLPGDFPEEVTSTADEVMGDADTPYTKMLALQEWFRSDLFTYSTDVRSGHDGDYLTVFLREKVGYCEQFAGAFAAMARSQGIPARVAIGFTPGERDPDDPDLFTVRGRHAHAWPEVHLTGIGWVPFEPTPGRGMPGAMSHTGVPPQQAEPDGSVDTTPTTDTSSPGPSVTEPGTDPGATTPTTAAIAPGGGSDMPEHPPWEGDAESPADTRWRWAAGAVVLGLAAWIAVLVVGPRLRRLRRSGAGRSPVIVAWDLAVGAVGDVTGAKPSAAETNTEYAERVGPAVGDLSEDLDELAALATTAAWRPGSSAAPTVERARSLGTRISHEIDARDSRRRRLVRRLSPRRALFGGGPPRSG